MNTPTYTPPLTPHELTRTEAIVELCKLAFGADDRQRLAVLKAVKALGKEIKHRADYARNLALRKTEADIKQLTAHADKLKGEIAAAMGDEDPPFVTPAPAPLSPDVPPMTEPSAPAPDAAETPNTNE